MGNNIIKSFNFRNGVQVDEDNFIVNPNGLVGIGTSIPTEILDVYGTAKITGLVTTTNLAVSGVSTFYGNVKIGSAITFNSSTGIVSATAFYGDGQYLLNVEQVAVDGWIVNAGTLSTASKVGIGTTIPYYSLQVGNDPLTGNGFSVDALSGNVNTTGILTASNFKTIGSITGYNFSGFGTDITGINATNISNGNLNLPSGIITAYSFSGFGTGITGIGATNISNGTLNNSRLPSSINLTGIITGYSFSGFGTDITGINATNISNGTLNNSRLPTDLNISGIITANSGVVTSLTAGIASITQLYVSGVTTSIQGFEGNIVGIASTALSLSGSPSITVTNITSTNINNIGVITSLNLHIGTADVVNFTALSSGNVGIGTTNPTSELQIRKSGQSRLEVISDTSSAIISIGQSVGVGNSRGTLQYNAKNVELSNNDTGNLDFYIHRGNPGISTGNFRWFYGQGNSQKLTLTYEGKLGIGETNPNETFHVVGTSTVTSNAYFGNHIYVKENIYFKSLKDGVVETNTYVTSGISTFSTLYLYGGTNVLGIGTNNAGTYKFKIQDNSPAYLGNDVGIGTTNATDPADTSQSVLKVFGNSYLRSANIGTSISVGSGIVTASNGFTSGVGTAVKISVIGNQIYFYVGTASTSLQLY